MSALVDTSVWYAAVDRGDRNNSKAKAILSQNDRWVTTDHILVESWFLLRHRINRHTAEAFWDGIRSGVAMIETVVSADLEAAWIINNTFHDQDFSIVDRTSFAVMQRLGIKRVASFDIDFSIFRYGRNLDKAFEVMR